MSSYWSMECDSVNVLGITLREPLTIAHVMLMSEVGSPILSDNPISPGDLALAVLICSQHPDKARRAMKSKTAGLAFKIWGLLFSHRDLQKESDKFAQWFSFHASTPPRWGDGGGKPLASPWWINRVAIAMGECGMSYKDATSLPCRVVGQITSSLMEAKGAIRLESERETQFIRWAMEQAKQQAMEAA